MVLVPKYRSFQLKQQLMTIRQDGAIIPDAPWSIIRKAGKRKEEGGL